jgi:hypothetical protein
MKAGAQERFPSWKMPGLGVAHERRHGRPSWGSSLSSSPFREPRVERTWSSPDPVDRSHYAAIFSIFSLMNFNSNSIGLT